MIRVVLPQHLRNLAGVPKEIAVEVEGKPCPASVIDALEGDYPMLRGTLRDIGTQNRRPFVRFFACQEDMSLDPLDTPLPQRVVDGEEPFMIIGAIAGG